MKKIIVKIFLLLNWAVILALLISYLSGYIAPDKFWIPAFFGLAYPFMVAGNIVFIIVWLILKPRYMVFSLIAVAAGWGLLQKYVQLNGEETGKPDIKILSYNVHHFVGDGVNNNKESTDTIVNFLQQQNADIICLQEARLQKKGIFDLKGTVNKLNGINHYQYARSSDTYGSVIMTRFPIINMGEIRFKNSRNISIYSDVKIQKDTVRIINVHLQSYYIDPKRYSIIDSLDITGEKDLKEVREMGSKFKRGFKLRAEQVRVIRKYVDDSPYPVIVCGDFNDTPASYSYHTLGRDLNDAFVSSGKGIGRTYVGKLPSFRIDYVLYSNHFKSYNFQTYDFHMSDHLPISTGLVWEQKQE